MNFHLENYPRILVGRVRYFFPMIELGPIKDRSARKVFRFEIGSVCVNAPQKFAEPILYSNI